MKKLNTLLFSISLCLCFSFITTDSVFLGTQTDGLNVGEKAPGFTIESPDGKEFSLNDYKGKVVLLDFWASWCGPCQMMAPIFKDAAAHMPFDARFAKVNTEHAQGVSGQYGIRSIPTLIVFHQGKEIDRLAGALPAAQLQQWIRQALLKAKQ